MPGKLSSVDKVIVDVGTGYYVERSLADAKKMYEEKIAFVNSNLETLQETIQRKQDNVRVVVDITRAVSETLNSARLRGSEHTGQRRRARKQRLTMRTSLAETGAGPAGCPSTGCLNASRLIDCVVRPICSILDPMH